MEKKDFYKRKRFENWNEEDKMLLKDLIRQNVSRIENKNTDTNTNQAKKKAWLDVADSFNDLCTGGQRNLTQLKTQWAATKISARKDVSQHRKEMLKTGGGPQPQEVAASSTDIASWLPNEFIVDENKFDSDFIMDEFNLEILEDENKVVVDDVIEIDPNNMCEVSELTPKSIPIFKKKTPAKKNLTEDSIKKLADSDIQRKGELHELQMDCEKRKQRILAKEEEIKELQIEVEKKRLINLNEEHDMLRAKRMFYENKLLEMKRN